MTLVQVGERLVDRERVLAELHPPLRDVESERPDHPVQRANRLRWEGKSRARWIDIQAETRSQMADAKRFVAEREAASRSRATARPGLQKEIAAYAARKRRRTT